MNTAVTIITPTMPNRHEYLLRCRDMVKHQTYGGKIYHIVHDGSQSIGAKLNEMIRDSQHDIIIRFDDDDIYLPDYIQCAVDALTDSNNDIVGFRRAYMYDRAKDRMYDYHYTGSQPYVPGSGSCFYRDTAIDNPYPDSSYGEDGIFSLNIGRVGYIPDSEKHMLVSIHSGNTASSDHLGTIPLVRDLSVKEGVKKMFGKYLLVSE